MITINNIKIENNNLGIDCILTRVQAEEDGQYQITIPLPYIPGSAANIALKRQEWDMRAWQETYLENETYDAIMAKTEIKTKLRGVNYDQ